MALMCLPDTILYHLSYVLVTGIRNLRFRVSVRVFVSHSHKLFYRGHAGRIQGSRCHLVLLHQLECLPPLLIRIPAVQKIGYCINHILQFLVKPPCLFGFPTLSGHLDDGIHQFL